MVCGRFLTVSVLRGNSASGKSTAASAIRDRCGRGIAIVGQDNLRRIVLRERDVPGGAYIGLVDAVARYALDHGYHTIIEGILYTAHCADMLTALGEDHRGGSFFYYLDVPFEETVRRHAGKPQAHEYGRTEMGAWYRDSDLLPGGIEQVIPAASTLDATVARILRDTSLPAQRRTPG
jgi:predicted kinase